MKEISYIHAEGYPAAEMKHGALGFGLFGSNIKAMPKDLRLDAPDHRGRTAQHGT
jgi:hypothetical protein